MMISSQKDSDSIGEVNFLTFTLRRGEFWILKMREREGVRPKQRFFLNWMKEKASLKHISFGYRMAEWKEVSDITVQYKIFLEENLEHCWMSVHLVLNVR